MNFTIPPFIFKAVRSLGKPMLVFAAIALFLGFAVSKAVYGDIWDQAVHLVGIMLIVLVAVLVLLVACVFLFDAFLSFREFGAAIKRWEAEPASFRMEDAIIVLSMAVRSGLVFLGITLLTHGALAYLDFSSG